MGQPRTFLGNPRYWIGGFAGRNSWNVFGGAGVRVAPPLSFIAEWTGQDMTLAASITPLRNHRLGITLGYADVTGSAGDGARFVMGMTFTHDFAGAAPVSQTCD